METPVQEIRLGDMILARCVIRRAKELLSPMLSYLVEHTPETNFYSHDDGFELWEVAFESPDTYDRLIIRDKAMWVHIHGAKEVVVLAKYNCFNDITTLTTDMLMSPSEDVKNHFTQQNTKYSHRKE